MLLPAAAIERLHLRQAFEHGFRPGRERQQLKPRLDLPGVLPLVPRVFGIVRICEPFVDALHDKIGIDYLPIEHDGGQEESALPSVAAAEAMTRAMSSS